MHRIFRLRPPSDTTVHRAVDCGRDLPWSYSGAGCTRNETPPSGFVVDRTRAVLASGALSGDAFERARAAIRRWQPFALGWVRVHDATAPLEPGTVVCVLIRTLGLHSANLARVVYVIDEADRFGFAYGTLAGAHVERGEERFLVTLEPDGTVRHEILAYSRPWHPLAWIGYPYARREQARFRDDSIAAMRRATQGSTE